MELPPLTRDQVRRVDQTAIEEYGLPGIALMENAGRGAAERIDQLPAAGEIAILCGPGNNGGDGYVIARHLELLGHSVRILTLVDPVKLGGDARINADVASSANIHIHRIENREDLQAGLQNATVLVDAMLGTGARGAPRGLYADAIRLCNQSDALRIAIDIPSGLDCDTGVAHDPTFQADRTLTFVASKVGFNKNNADASVGVVEVVGIGVPLELLKQIPDWPANS